MFRTACSAAAVAAATFAFVLTGPADAQRSRIQVGKLDCSLSSSIGLLVTSSRNISCYFKPENGPQEAYAGTMTRYGLDIGVTSGGTMSWVVFADTDRYTGMLTGTYAGATAELTIAAGLGANVLVGGSRSIALQPISVQQQTGLNIAAGVSALELHLAQ